MVDKKTLLHKKFYSKKYGFFLEIVAIDNPYYPSRKIIAKFSNIEKRHIPSLNLHPMNFRETFKSYAPCNDTSIYKYHYYVDFIEMNEMFYLEPITEQLEFDFL